MRERLICLLNAEKLKCSPDSKERLGCCVKVGFRVNHGEKERVVSPILKFQCSFKTMVDRLFNLVMILAACFSDSTVIGKI